MFLWQLVSISVVLLAGCQTYDVHQGMANVNLTGKQQVPPVKTLARGSGLITIGSDRSVSGRIMTYGIVSTAAHIHMAAPGQNGPVIIPLTRTVDDVWSVPAGATLTEEQYDNYKSGNLYVNVHTAANKGGEIRGQVVWGHRWDRIVGGY